ncbi:MAG: hypothetical protein US40_C0010G0020 [Candidatus Roizmanbacteria bacterium GW2011_GWC2_37_13]|uniref:Uncharacterized protein n=1 Tax=Candidatus Roizmanbacteria bacterium GW2011_GWC2_37_13 TaxID=1618486 RepID=A0A0G0G5D0_9BACT|nr:MAG: hypothetical protein US38_C0011G0021 [Candidatus Roizmanbacteria bacterium GW2011_GWC1_37_12]KKQ25237.1 MAG: hypothetical protein US40_C0010G0020 [Candidatus Roizmanbacteria bacterium GW2011_GWC2_37_13]
MIFKKYLQIFEKKAIKIEKRLRLVISVFILTSLLVFSTFFYFDKAPIFIPVLLIASFLLAYFSLLEGIEKMAWFGLFFMPVALTIFFYTFYFLFPGRWLTRIPFIIIYGVSLYAVLLSANIFNVGVEKNLQLYRAAFSINFFYQAFLAFIIFNILFSFKGIFLINMVIVGGIGFLLALQLFWTIKLDKQIEKEVVNYALFLSILLGELAVLVSFIPLRGTIAALFLTASYYSLGGVIYNFIDQKLFKETIREYVFVWIFVLIITVLSISW